MSQLSKIEPQELAVPEPSILTIINRVAQSGISGDNVAVLERMIALKEREETREAAKAFASSFVAMQAETGRIKAERAVPGSDGTTRYVYAAFEDIMRQVQPILSKHGFAIAFDSRTDGERITSRCKLMHRDGHSQSNEFQCRIGQGPPKATASQADGSASTYAKRFALCAALNIVIEKDDDARAVGAPIDTLAAQELRRRVAEIGADEALFLRHAGAASFEVISMDRLEDLHQMLDRKAAKKSKL